MWAGGKWGARVDAVERNSAHGAERRAATVADRSFDLPELASSLFPLDLLAGHVCGGRLRACGIGRVRRRSSVVHPARKPGGPGGWCLRRRLDATEGARAVHHRKQKRQARRRNTGAVSAQLRRQKQSKNVRRQAPAGKLSAVKSGARSLRGHETVVVVTEHAPSRGVLSRLLKRMGYRVVEAASGLEAQQLTAGERRIDLLLVEFSALGTGGVELVRWFSANRPEIKVLVASDWLWEVESCLGDLPRVGVLAKQFTPAELARMVRAILH
jgi:CheY-like chemotaxis protein